MVTRVGGELVPNSGPALIVDQGRLLTGVELTLVRDLAGVNWVREHCVEMTAREGFAAALGAVRCRAAFRPKPETVGLLLDPAHAAERQRQLRQFAQQLNGSQEVGRRPRPELKPGTRLVREWQGRTYDVPELDDGFSWS